MITLERVDPSNYTQLDRYMGMLNQASSVPEVADHLPEIFEEGSVHRVQTAIHDSGALRFFVNIEGQTTGRLELGRSLNDDPSIVPRIPEGVQLGYNTCYFINPVLLGRNLELAHQNVADLSIRRALNEGDEREGKRPWLPISLEGQDVSRGWLMQAYNPYYEVIGDEPETGIFPQFGIGDNAYSIQTARPLGETPDNEWFDGKIKSWTKHKDGFVLLFESIGNPQEFCEIVNSPGDPEVVTLYKPQPGQTLTLTFVDQENCPLNRRPVILDLHHPSTALQKGDRFVMDATKTEADGPLIYTCHCQGVTEL